MHRVLQRALLTGHKSEPGPPAFVAEHLLPKAEFDGRIAHPGW